MTDALPTIIPSQTALLVMDYQQGILGSLPEAPTLLARASEAIAIVRGSGGHVGYVRVGFTDADFDAIPSRNKIFRAIAASKALHSDSPTTAVHEDVAPKSGDIVVRKTRVGPFLTTNLEQQLRERSITTLILAGLSTSGVVLSTVRDAADRDYELFVLADACADPQPGVHEFLTEKILSRQAHVITVADLPALFPKP